MTKTLPLVERMEALAIQHGDEFVRPRESWAKSSFSEGFRAALELPEVKALVEAAHDVVGMQLKTMGTLQCETGIGSAINNLCKELNAWTAFTGEIHE